MKNLIALLFVLLLFAVPAMSQESEVTEILWEDYEGLLDSTATGGDFIDFEEAGIRIFIPEGLDPMDLPETLKNNGYLGYFRKEDHSIMVVISKVNSGDKTPTGFVEEMQSHIPEIKLTELYKINGMDAAIFDDPTHDETNCILKTEESLIRVSVQPVSNYEASMLSEIVFFSVQIMGD